MDYGYVLKRAWKIIWKFKILWLFGILASCGQASGSSGGNARYSFSSQDTSISPQVEHFFNQLDPGVVALFIGIGIFLVLVMIVLAILLGTVGRVGLIRGTVKAEQGATHLTFGELWRDGMTYFWRVFGLNLLVGVIIFLPIIAVILGMIMPTVFTLGLCLIPLICVFIPVMWAISVVIEQANIALVTENLGISEAIKRGWQVVRDNIGTMLVMSLILFLGVGLIGNFVIGLPVLIVLIPAFISWVSVMTENTVAFLTSLIVSGLLFLVYLPVWILLSGALRSYTSTAWTLTYMRLTNKSSQSIDETPILTEDIDIPPASDV